MITRREFLELLGLSSAYLILHPYVGFSEEGLDVFPCGVASGDPTATEITLWTKLGDIHEKMQKDLKLYILDNIQRNPNNALKAEFLREIVIPASKITKKSDYVVKIRLTNLEPGKNYFYIFDYAGVRKLGRFKTLPTGNVESLSFGFVTCQNYEDGYFTAYKHLAEEEDLQFIVHLGDFIYEKSYGEKIPGRKLNFPSGDKFAKTLEDYRYLYKLYLSDPNFQAARAMHTFINIWDDHEFANDYYFDFSKGYYMLPSHPKIYSENKEASLKLRMASIIAWHEYIPADVKLKLDDKNPLNWIRIYRDFKVSNFLHLICTDERSYRQSQCPKRFQSPGCETQYTHTMLGSQQKSWFFDKLKENGFSWKVWANGVQFVQNRINGLYGSTDAWDGYIKEREEIISFVKKNNINNMVVITGDRHAFLAAEIPDNFSENYKPIGVEFITGTLSAINASEAKWFKRDFPFKDVDEYTQAEIKQNPWIKYLNHKTWGYSVLKLTKDQAVCEFYSVNKFSENSPKELLAKFVYTKGKELYIEKG